MDMDRIEDEALRLFREIDKDDNGYLSRSELELAKKSKDARASLVAEVLLANFDWLKDQANDEFGAETEISRRDIVFASAFRDDKDECSKVMKRFEQLDTDKNGCLTFWEFNSVNNKPENKDISLFFNCFVHRNPRYSDRMYWIAGLSNDYWGPEEDRVTMADLKVFKQGADMIRRMDAILNSKSQKDRPPGPPPRMPYAR